MAAIVGLDDLSKALIGAGTNLLSPHSSTEELLTLLDDTESLLRNVEQDPPFSMQNALIPSRKALVSVDLLNHPDSDVRVSVVSCLAEIVRITAPESPYDDDRMKEIFRLAIEAFEKLADGSSRTYRKAESVLDNVAKVQSCLVMLDLECNDLILQMFRKFLTIIRSDHPQVVFSSMEMIMLSIIDESDQVPTDLLFSLLASVRKDNQNVSPMSWSLAEKVLSRCGRKLKPYIIDALKSTGTSLDMYSPVVSSICHSVSDTTKANNIVYTRKNEAAETRLGRQVAPTDVLEEKLELGHSRMDFPTKRPARGGNRKSSNMFKQSLKQVPSESTDVETELGTTGKRGRKPNSLMNPEEGYDITWISGKRVPLRTSSNKKIKKNGSGGESFLGKVAARKTPLPKETSPATSRALTGSVKCSRIKMDDNDHDVDSLSSPRIKKLTSCFRDEEPFEESNEESFEKLYDDKKIRNSSNKTRSQSGLEKFQKSAKKPIVEAKSVNYSGKRTSVLSDAKRTNFGHGSLSVSQSSKGKKMNSQVAARQLTDESDKVSKGRPTRRRTARNEESDMNEFSGDLVGKRVNIWWPLDKTYYEGVIDSYSSRKKMHRIIYTDGEKEDLNLNRERWEIIEDLDSDSEAEEIDLPESIPLSDIMQKQIIKKIKNVEPTSSSGLRSSSKTLMKNGPGKKLNKQVKRSKSGSKAEAVNEEPENTREGKNVRSLKELNEETDRAAEEQEVSLDAESDRTNEQENKDDCSEKQEQSKKKGVEGNDTEEEETQYPYTEVENEEEEEESGSEEEPKWRDTEDLEDEAEESKELDEIEKEDDEERDS